ncbi:unnamed protein product [Penicillium glandicola]
MITPSPKKRADSMGDLTATEIKLLVASVLCTTGKVDTEKLGKLTDMKKKSAASRFPGLKRKLEKIFEDKLATLGEETESPEKDVSPAKSRSKRREKVVEQKPETKLETKPEAESGGSSKTPVKVESDSEESPESTVKLDFDLVKVKLEPID